MGEQAAIFSTEGPVRHLMTVEEFLILDRAGAFQEIGHVELVERDMFFVGPFHRSHGQVSAQLIMAFGLVLREGAFPHLHLLGPVSAHLEEHSLPQADLFVVTHADEDFVSRDTARIAVEVSVTSLRYDLGRKARLYARTGIPEYWVADVNGSRIIRMAEPHGDSYLRRDAFAFSEKIASATIAGLVIDTATLA